MNEETVDGKKERKKEMNAEEHRMRMEEETVE